MARSEPAAFGSGTLINPINPINPIDLIHLINLSNPIHPNPVGTQRC